MQKIHVKFVETIAVKYVPSECVAEYFYTNYHQNGRKVRGAQFAQFQ